MFKKLTILFTVIALSLLALTGCSNSTGGGSGTAKATGTTNGNAKYTFKISTEENPTDIQGMYATKFKKLIEQKTNGQVKVQIYDAGQLGTDTNSFEAVQNGAIQFAVSSPGVSGTIIPQNQVLSIPFLFTDNLKTNQQILQNSKALNNKLSGIYAKKGIKVLSYWTEGFDDWTSDKPIQTPSDFNGFKMRTMTSPLLVKAFKAYGANPTAMDWSEVYSALQLHSLNGQENPDWFIDSSKLYQVQKYLIESHDMLYITSTIVNQKYFNSLPKDIQKDVLTVIDQLTSYSWQLVEQKTKNAVSDLKKNGMTVLNLSAANRAKFQQLSVPARSIYVKQAGSQGQQILDTLQSEIKAANSSSSK